MIVLFLFIIIIKVFRLQRKTLLLFFGFFFPIIIIIIIIFLTRFLRDAWTDFHEIFRDGRYWPGIENVEPDF